MRRIPSGEPEKPQDTQIILSDPRLGIFDKPHPPRHEVRQPAQRVQHRAIRLGIKRVHGEIAPTGVFLDAAGKRHHRTPAIGFNVFAERRHLKGLALCNNRDRAMLHPGRDRLQPCRFCQPRYLFGPRICRKVHVAVGQAQQRIPHTAADKEHIIPASCDSRADRLRGRVFQPSCPWRDYDVMRSVHARNIRAVAPQM